MKLTEGSERDPNFIEMSTALFIKYYNKNIPETFPSASFKALHEFRARYPGLFKGIDNDWTVDKHRKKLMDWLASYRKLTGEKSGG